MANNLRALGGQVILAGVVGRDGAARSRPAAQAAALGMVEAVGKFGNGVRPFAAGGDRQGDEG